MDKKQLVGYGYIVSNLAVMSNGLIAYMKGDTEHTRNAGLGRAVTGLLWNIPAVMLGHYGGQPVERQLDRMQHKLAAFMQQEGVPLDAGTLKKADEEKQRGWFSKLEDFLYQYSIETNDVMVAASSLGMMYSGIERRREGKTESGNRNIAVSALTMGAALTSIMVPEKTEAQIAAKGQTGTLWGRLQKSPLAASSSFFLAADVMEGMGALAEYKNAKALAKDNPFKPWAFGMSALSALTMVSFLASDSLLGTGSKKASGGAEEHEKAKQQLLKEAATILAAQPKESREALIQKTVEYMIKQPELRFSDCCDPEKLQQEILAMIEGHTVPKNCPEVIGKHTQKLAQESPSFVVTK